MSTTFDPTCLRVYNEGASLNVWHQGKGPLLILIQGGGGDGARFNAAMPTLSERYTVATYDRRGNAGSPVEKGMPLNPVQSARDVVSIIKSLGFDKASLFGASSGGLIAMQLAASYPQYLDHAIIHEAPTLSLLVGEKTDRLDEGYEVYNTFITEGAEAALHCFKASVQGRLHDVVVKQSDSPLIKTQKETNICARSSQSSPSTPPHRLQYFFEQEFLFLNSYTPPFAQIRANKVSIAVVEGEESGDIFYAKVTRDQAKVLECEHFIWPGGHTIFHSHPLVFAKSLMETLEILDNQRKRV